MQPWETVLAPCERAAAAEVPDDERPGEGADERIAVHVERVGPHGRQAEVLGELILGVHHDRFDRAAVKGAPSG